MTTRLFARAIIHRWSLRGVLMSIGKLMYDFDRLPEEDQQKILADGVDNYINITYERKILWAPVSWYTSEPVQK